MNVVSPCSSDLTSDMVKRSVPDDLRVHEDGNSKSMSDK